MAISRSFGATSFTRRPPISMRPSPGASSPGVSSAACVGRPSAVAMLARADDDRMIRLNPDDLALVGPRLSAEWQVQPDPALPRGSLRVETASCGVEDGPDQWRRAIAEALHQC